MKMSGDYVVNASRQEVWDALNDAEVLKACIPGCQELTKSSDTDMEAVVHAKVGPVKAKFKGKVTLSELDPPNGYTISGEGSGGAAGFAKGGAKVALTDADGGGTTLTYEVDAQIGGKLAQIGQRLIDGTAKKMADEFFSNFAERFEAEEEAEHQTAAVEKTLPTTEAKTAEPQAEPKKSTSPQMWIWILAGVTIWAIVAAQML